MEEFKENCRDPDKKEKIFYYSEKEKQYRNNLKMPILYIKTDNGVLEYTHMIVENMNTNIDDSVVVFKTCVSMTELDKLTSYIKNKKKFE